MPPFTRAMFIDRSKYCEQILKKVTQDIPVKLFQNRTSDSRGKHFYIISEIKSILLPWQPQSLMESNFVNSFYRGPPRNIPVQIGTIGPAVWEEKMFKELVDDALRTTDDGHSTTLKAPL